MNVKLYSCQDAAEKLGVHPSRIRLLCDQDRIVGAQKIGGRWLIPAPIQVLDTQGSRHAPGKKIKMKRSA